MDKAGRDEYMTQRAVEECTPLQVAALKALDIQDREAADTLGKLFEAAFFAGVRHGASEVFAQYEEARSRGTEPSSIDVPGFLRSED